MSNIFIHEFGTLKLDKEGILYHDDIAFVHEGTTKLFKKNIVCENGEYFIKIGDNKAKVVVEDVYLWIENIDILAEESKISLYLTNDQIIKVDKNTEIYLENDNLYHIDDNLKAKFNRKTYNELMNYLSQPYENYLLKIGSLEIKIIQK